MAIINLSGNEYSNNHVAGMKGSFKTENIVAAMDYENSPPNSAMKLHPELEQFYLAKLSFIEKTHPSKEDLKAFDTDAINKILTGKPAVDGPPLVDNRPPANENLKFPMDLMPAESHTIYYKPVNELKADRDMEASQFKTATDTKIQGLAVRDALVQRNPEITKAVDMHELLESQLVKSAKVDSAEKLSSSDKVKLQEFDNRVMALIKENGAESLPGVSAQFAKQFAEDRSERRGYQAPSEFVESSDTKRKISDISNLLGTDQFKTPAQLYRQPNYEAQQQNNGLER